MVPFLNIHLGARVLRPLRDRALSLTRSCGVRRIGWILLKVVLFITAFLAAWLTNLKVAGAEAGPSGEDGAAKPTAPAGAPAAAGQIYDGVPYGDLAIALAERWRVKMSGGGKADAADPGSVRVKLYDLAIGASALVGASEDPRRRMEAVTREVFERRGFRVLAPPDGGFGPRELLIDEVLERKAGSPLAVLCIYLAVAEILIPPLDLRPVMLPRGAAARFQDGGIALSALLTASDPGPVLRDDLLRARAGDGPPLAGDIKPLTRGELAGEVLRGFARAALDIGANEAALSLLVESAAASPGRKEPWAALSEIHRRSGDPARERDALDHLLALDPADGKALARRAALLLLVPDLAGAEKDIRRALENDPPPPAEAFLVLGDLEIAQGRPDRAIAAYRRFTAGGPPEPLRARALARIQDLEIQPSVAALRGGGEYPEKFEALRRIAAARAPSSTEALIASLRDGNLRFARLAWRTLQDVTGQEIGFDPEAWERWWAGKLKVKS